MPRYYPTHRYTATFCLILGHDGSTAVEARNTWTRRRGDESSDRHTHSLTHSILTHRPRALCSHTHTLSLSPRYLRGPKCVSVDTRSLSTRIRAVRSQQHHDLLYCTVRTGVGPGAPRRWVSTELALGLPPPYITFLSTLVSLSRARKAELAADDSIARRVYNASEASWPRSRP